MICDCAELPWLNTSSAVVVWLPEWPCKASVGAIGQGGFRNSFFGQLWLPLASFHACFWLCPWLGLDPSAVG
eukprot:4412023-Lingulodinium_polyedra.AAC.1